jgi:hypothetical protein
LKQTYTVSTTAGGTNAGSLGAAMTSASTDGNPSDTVGFRTTFDTPQTITLTGSYAAVSGQTLVFNDPAPAALLTLNGNGFSIFNIVNDGAVILNA